MGFLASSIIFFTLSLFFFGDNVHMAKIKSKFRIVDPSAKEDANRDYIKYEVILVKNRQVHCGGTIIGARFILTAAHCVINMKTNEFEDEPLTVIAGTNTLLESDYRNRIYRNVEEIIVPKYYENFRQGYDIAVLRLDISFSPDSGLKMLSLPSEDDNYENVRAVVSGFGVSDLEYSHVSQRIIKYNPVILRYQFVYVLPETICREFYGTTFGPGKICGRLDGLYTRGGVCNGDSGSGLSYDNKVIGIVSYGFINCTEGPEGRPTIYTDVSYFSELIVAIMNGYRDPTYVRVRRYNVDGRW